MRVDLKLDPTVWEQSYLYPQPNCLSENVISWEGNLLKNQKEDSFIISTSGKKYSYLFWEATTISQEANSLFIRAMDNYYIFSSEEVCDRLDDILIVKGLNTRERQDLITFWMPELTSKEFCLISFLNNNVYESIASLDVDPAPKRTLRIFMVFKPVDSIEGYHRCANLLEEEEKFDREEFKDSLVVEWGAMNLEKFY